MVNANRKHLVERLFSVLIMCAVLFSTILPFSVSAAEHSDPEGEWLFDNQVAFPNWVSLSETISGEVQFGCSDSFFTDIYFDHNQLTISFLDGLSGEYVQVFSEHTGWTDEEYRTIYFTGNTESFPSDVWTWLNENACQVSGADGVAYCLTSVTIDGETFVFSGQTSSPTVYITVNTSGIVLQSGIRSLAWDYSGLGTFAGLAYGVGTEPVFTPGSDYTLPGGSGQNAFYTLYSIAGDLPEVFTTTIRIYNNDGSHLLHTYSEYATGASPTLSLTVTSSGLTFSKNAVVIDRFVAELDGAQADLFAGFATRRNANTATYAQGASFPVGGLSQDCNIDLYIVYDTVYADPTDADWTGWIATAVSGFLDFELWPGLALGDLMLTCLAIGVLFWFLRMTA